MHFFMITNNPEIAQFAAVHAIDWIVVDLESIGKADRQGHLDTLISSHSVEDIRRLRSVVPPGKLLVRTNPLNTTSAAELDDVVSAGADWVMLPYFHSADEVAEYVRILDGRAKLALLAETKGAMDSLQECCEIPSVMRVHIGLNDLSLELERTFMFQLLVDGTVEKMAATLRDAGMPFGIGGIARVGEGLLPAEDIMIQHARLGSDAAILSRTFHRQAISVAEIESRMNFAAEIDRLRMAYRKGKTLDDGQLKSLARTLAENIEKIAGGLPERSKAHNAATG